MSEHIFRGIMERVTAIIDSNEPAGRKLQSVCELLRKEVPHYDWVRFYFVDPENRNELVLGPFSGEPTEHTRIKFGEGICGQAAETEKVFIVQDVSKEDNYLSCSPDVRSEIVVPIFRDGEIVGELDIDSHRLNAFSSEDSEFLEWVCKIVGEIL